VTAAAEIARTGAAAHAVADRLDPARAAARASFYHGGHGSHSLLWVLAARVLVWLRDHLGLGPGAISLGGALRLVAVAALVAGAAALAVRLAPRRLRRRARTARAGTEVAAPVRALAGGGAGIGSRRSQGGAAPALRGPSLRGGE
jgi:hypothetical protein